MICWIGFLERESKVNRILLVLDEKKKKTCQWVRSMWRVWQYKSAVRSGDWARDFREKISGNFFFFFFFFFFLFFFFLFFSTSLPYRLLTQGCLVRKIKIAFWKIRFNHWSSIQAYFDKLELKMNLTWINKNILSPLYHPNSYHPENEIRNVNNLKISARRLVSKCWNSFLI